MNWKLTLLMLLASALVAQAPASKPAARWQSLAFLEGTWEAKTPASPSGPEVSGFYVFREELNGQVLARHSGSDGCKAPADFDCDHRDLLYLYQDKAGQPVRAIYFDNEGHVLHYAVSTPAANKVEFLSDPTVPGPQFRLVYELVDGTMAGKFQMRMPGQGEWKSYLEWSGKRK